MGATDLSSLHRVEVRERPINTGKEQTASYAAGTGERGSLVKGERMAGGRPSLGTRSCWSILMLSTSGSMPAPDPRHLDLLMPLAFFYGRLDLELPPVEFVDGAELTEPQRRLLVHSSDMTPRLREYYQSAPSLTVVSVERTEDYVIREVVLNCEGKPVEYGAIGIYLDGFPPHVRTMIRGGTAPLGAILESEGVPHTSAPTGYFVLEADSHMAELLGTAVGARLCGRSNVLSHPDGTGFADIVEVLPPG